MDDLEEQQIRDRASAQLPPASEWNRHDLEPTVLISYVTRCDVDDKPDRYVDAQIDAFLEGYTEIANDGRFVVAWGDKVRPLGMLERGKFVPNGDPLPRYTETPESRREVIERLRWSLG